jgi:hypothetical protein
LVVMLLEGVDHFNWGLLSIIFGVLVIYSKNDILDRSTLILHWNGIFNLHGRATGSCRHSRGSSFGIFGRRP